MSVAALTGLSVCLAALVFVFIAAIWLGLRATRLAKRVHALESHPTLVVLRSAGNARDRLHGVGQEIAASRERLRRIGTSLAQIAASAALLDLSIDRVAFATRLFLQTFLPTLRGSMRDM